MNNKNIIEDGKKTRIKKGQVLNPNGRPRKGIAVVNEELAQKGYSPATKQDIEANYMAMLQLSKNDLVAMGNDESKPMLIRILAKNMLGGKGFDIIEKMLDRGIGKAVQREEKREVDSQGNDKDSVINITINGNKDNISVLE